MKSKQELQAMAIEESERQFRRELLRDLIWILPMIVMLAVPMFAMFAIPTPGLLLFAAMLAAMFFGYVGFEYAR